MKAKIILTAILLVAAGLVGFSCWLKHPVLKKQTPVKMVSLPLSGVAATEYPSNTFVIPHRRSKVRYQFFEFTDDEKSSFLKDFETRYKPALARWCNVYSNRVPFSPDAVTLKNFVERIGRDSTYNEYVFVVDGITLGIRDTKGLARVDYLNNPRQTRKMAMLPDGHQAPIVTMPINRQEVMTMLATDGETSFPANEVRMTPSGFSGGLNGGIIVTVGGNPRNGASWKYNLVFDADGKLVFYLKSQ